MPFHLTISRAIVVFGVAVVLGLAAIIGTSNYALQQTKWADRCMTGSSSVTT